VELALGVCNGLGPVAGGVCGAAGGAAGATAGAAAAGAAAQAGAAAAGTVFDEATRWVVSGAMWLIGEAGRALSASTSVDLGSAWFGAHEKVMAALGAAVVVPMACAAAIQAVYRQSPSMLVRTFALYLPLSLVLTGVVVTLVQLGLRVTDVLSAQVLSSAGTDTSHVFTGVTSFLSAGPGPTPGFVVFAGALLVVAGAFVLWLELAVRAAAVSAAVLFLPLALAALVWPAVAHWCRRLADTLVALVLSKLVVAAVLSLGVAALAAGTQGSSAAGSAGGFSAVVTGVALLLLSTLAPFSLLRLVPAVEAGAAAHLESARHRMQSTAGTSAARGGELARDLARVGSPSVDDEPVGTAGGGGSGGGVGIGALRGGAGGASVSGAQAAPGDGASQTAGAVGASGEVTLLQTTWEAAERLASGARDAAGVRSAQPDPGTTETTETRETRERAVRAAGGSGSERVDGERSEP